MTREHNLPGGGFNPEQLQLKEVSGSLIEAGLAGEAVIDKEEGIAALKVVPGVDPVLAVLDKQRERIPERGWIVSATVNPGYEGVAEIYGYKVGGLAIFKDSDDRKKWGEARVGVNLKNYRWYAVAYENSSSTNKDIEPFDRTGESFYLPRGFSSLDSTDLSNGGRILDDRHTNYRRSLSTSTDWHDIDQHAPYGRIAISRVTDNAEELLQIMSRLGTGMGMNQQDAETFVGIIDTKVASLA